MLRLRSCVLSSTSTPSASLLYSLRSLLSATAEGPIPSSGPGFAAADYLVAACGLTRPKALKASAKLGHLKSRSNPDAVLAFLRGLGLSGAEVPALVARDPLFLCASVDKTLSPRVAALGGLGLSRPEIARLVPLIPNPLRCKSIVPNLRYYLALFGSFDGLLQVKRRSTYLLRSSLERVVKPNAAVLRECLPSPSDMAKLCASSPWLLSSNTERLRAMVACAEGLGVPRCSNMFRHALAAVAFLSEEKIAGKMKCLKETFGWSDDEAGVAVAKNPALLRRSEDKLRRVSEFLISRVGLEPRYIVHCPMMTNYSVEGRLRPRYYVFRFLKENGLLEHSRSYNTVVQVSEKVFMERYMSPHKEAAPHLAEDYAAACRGEVPTRFVFA